MKVTQKLSTKIFLMVNGTIILTLAIVLSISTYSFIRGIQTDVERQLTALTKEKAQRFEDALTHFVQLSHTIGNDPVAYQFFDDLHRTMSESSRFNAI